MAFVHSKFAKLYINQYDCSLFFNDFTLAAKANLSDATVYSLGAKIFISGIRDGTLSAKGFWDPVPGTASDAVLTNALGAADQVLCLGPQGVFSPGTRVLCGIAINADYSVTNPVANVIGVQATFTADGGLGTGTCLHDPAIAEGTAAATVTGQTGWLGTGVTRSAGGTFLDLLGQTNAGGYVQLHLASLTGTGSPTLTAASVQHSADVVLTGAAGSDATHIVTTGTAGAAATGIIAFVSPAGNLIQASYGSIATATTFVLDTAIAAADIPVTPFTVHTASASWVNIAVFPIGAGLTAAGFAYLNIATGVTINPWVRASTTTTGTTVTAKYLITMVRY